MTTGYLLDSNHISSGVLPGSNVQKRIIELRANGRKIGTCIPVLCEIEAGIQQVRSPDLYRVNLDRFLRYVRVWPLDQMTARLYGEIQQDLKKRGRVLSQVDMILAALARQMNLTLVTTDLDFVALADIPTENWT